MLALIERLGHDYLAVAGGVGVGAARVLLGLAICVWIVVHDAGTIAAVPCMIRRLDCASKKPRDHGADFKSWALPVWAAQTEAATVLAPAEAA